MSETGMNTKEDRLKELLNQSIRSEKAMSKHIVKLVNRINSITADKVAAEHAFEMIQQENEELLQKIDQLNRQKLAAEREERRVKALRYTQRKKSLAGVTA
jgi:uncharacterized protein (UPF0305 family)